MNHSIHHRQQGAALVVALVFLIVITLLGVSSMDETLLETQLAKNSREQNYALQVAENGLMLSAPVLNSTQLQALMVGSREIRIAANNEVAIDRADISTSDTTVTASSQNTQISYKGQFGSSRGVSCGTQPHSAQSYSQRYIETLTEGESAPRQRSLKLRSGFCQAAPKL